MGIFDKKMTSYKVPGKIISIEDLHKAFEDMVGTKYKVQLQKKGSNMLVRAMSGKTEDSILVAKNGYHRTLVYPYYDGNDTYFRFEETTVSPWIQFLSRQVGVIGSYIIQFSYGKGKEFYADVINVIRDKYKPEETEMNVGLSALWKKDNK